MSSDYEHMANLPDGTLLFDLISQSVRHSSGNNPTLWITGELSAWLNERLRIESIDASELASATLEVQYRTDLIATDRKKIISFDFESHSILTTDEATYEGRLVERHTYHQRADA